MVSVTWETGKHTIILYAGRTRSLLCTEANLLWIVLALAACTTLYKPQICTLTIVQVIARSCQDVDKFPSMNIVFTRCTASLQDDDPFSPPDDWRMPALPSSFVGQWSEPVDWSLPRPPPAPAVSTAGHMVCLSWIRNHAHVHRHISYINHGFHTRYK